MGSEISIVNQTEQDINICLRQLGPLHYENNVAPGKEFKRSVGKVWFTIEAKISTQTNSYNNMQVAAPIVFFTGAVLFGAGAVPLMIGAAPAIAGGAVAAATGGAAAGTGASALVRIANVVAPLYSAGLATGGVVETIKQWETSAFRKNGVYMGFNRRFAIRGGPEYVRKFDMKYKELKPETVGYPLVIVEIT